MEGGGRGGADEEGDEPRPKPPKECCIGAGGVGALELKLGAEDTGFDLEKAVCSHGLFMMAPNQWDPATRTFQRPLRLCSSASSLNSLSVVVRISHPHPRPSPLQISVFGTDSLSPPHQQFLLAQVRRMLRISEETDRVVEEFHKMNPAAKERGFGRVFRSPTLFEDMVKSILLCNCRWSRTLSMAMALCELQVELERRYSTAEHFQPRTPGRKALKGKRGCEEKITMKLEFVENESEASTCRNSTNDGGSSPKHPKRPKSDPNAAAILGIPCDGTKPIYNIFSGETGSPCCRKVGDFPSPEELAGLDEDFLSKACGLGYRAKRIMSLTRGIVKGKIQLEELEEICDASNPSSYQKLDERLSRFDGFGPFTRANVLMCMGFYHKIPADSETIRHLKMFHIGRRSSTTIHRIKKNPEDVYEDYAPYQFLAYWFELWNFYEQTFGNFSDMPPSDYERITGSNMEDCETAKKRPRINMI